MHEKGMYGKNMKKEFWIILVISLVSLILSGLNIYSWWKSEQNGQPIFLTYLVKTNGEAHYRIYVLVDSNTVIADEFVGSKIYPLFVQAGDQIEVHGYSETAFTVTLENPYYPVETETAVEILITYTVPEG